MAPHSLIGTWELSTVLEQRIDKMGSNIERQETDTNLESSGSERCELVTVQNHRASKERMVLGERKEVRRIVLGERRQLERKRRPSSLGNQETPDTATHISPVSPSGNDVCGAEVICGCELPLWVLRNKPRFFAKAVCFSTAGIFLQP